MHILDVFSQSHFCKCHDSKYGGRSAANCLYNGGRGTLASVRRESIGRLSGKRRQMIGVVRLLSADDRSTTGNRPTNLSTVSWLSPDVMPSVGFVCPDPVKSADYQLIVAR